MWLSFHRRYLTSIRLCHGAKLFAILATIIPAFLLDTSHGAHAQEEQLSMAGQAGHSILIREHAGWNMDCEAIEHPALYVVDPPRHGKVCARIENVRIRSMYVGTESQCIGHLIRGVRLIYRPDAAYVGDDGLRYAAQYPSVLRTISVKVTVTAGASSTLPHNIVDPMPRLRQMPGPVPACAELVF
jgi:hypothetical protein